MVVFSGMFNFITFIKSTDGCSDNNKDANNTVLLFLSSGIFGLSTFCSSYSHTSLCLRRTLTLINLDDIPDTSVIVPILHSTYRLKVVVEELNVVFFNGK